MRKIISLKHLHFNRYSNVMKNKDILNIQEEYRATDHLENYTDGVVQIYENIIFSAEKLILNQICTEQKIT